MYTKQEVSKIRQQFWTTFGQYLRPIKSVSGETVNWLNYKTGIKDLYFRMDAEYEKASIGIEFKQRNQESRDHYFQQFPQLKTLLHEELNEEWNWIEDIIDDDGNYMHVIRIEMTGVNVLQNPDWPSIIEFLKPRILALDKFWFIAKEIIH